MKFPKMPKLQLPKWISGIKFPKLFDWFDSQKSFVSVWKKFLGQIPRESRSTIHSYQHFIVLGHAKSGKSDLIQGVIEQCQDLYPFDTTYTADPDLQFYLGPNQVIQELSFAALEDKSIKGRKKTIKLWKMLYAKRDPIIVITYNCFSQEQNNLRDLNRLAQLIAGKIALLSEITKKPVKVRIALTHLDKIPGYLDFARFLKQENLTFDITLSSNFESNTLEISFKQFFEEHVTLMLTSISNNDFSKMMLFSKEMPTHFQAVEEFLRVLVSRITFASSVELDTLSLTSNQESSSSFNAFKWSKQPTMQIFFRYPLLKHQLASAGLLLLLVTPLIHYYLKEKNELTLAKQGIEQLSLLENEQFKHQLIPDYVASYREEPTGLIAYATPHFFGEKLDQTTNKLAERIRTKYFEKEYRKAALENRGELKCLYFNAILNATRDNYLGKYMLQNSKEMALATNLDENLLKAYIISCREPNKDSSLNNLRKANPFIPFTSFTPWVNFFSKVTDLCTQQLYMEQNFQEIAKESERLLEAVNYLNDHRLAFAITTILKDDEEKGAKELTEDIQVIQWIGDNLEPLCSCLIFIQNSSTAPFRIEDLNIAEFYSRIRKMAAWSEGEHVPYDFSLKGKLYSFDTKSWCDLVVAHSVERAIQKYTVNNSNSGGVIFFRNTHEASEPSMPLFTGVFPYFSKKCEIPGRYSRMEYENKVRSTAEKLAHWISTLSINPEDQRRFNNFLMQELASYVKTYLSYYDRLYQACEIQNASLENLKKGLQELTHEQSGFYDFLKFISEQTGGFSQPVMSWQNMQNFNQFDFLNTLLTVEGVEAPYAKYQSIIKELIHDIETEPSFEDTDYQIFSKPYLTNMAIISSNILQNNEKSYINRIKECLNNIGVPEKYQLAFQLPVWQLHKQGLIDLKKCVEQFWSMYFETALSSVLAKFPINPEGCETLCFEELEKFLDPKKEFSQGLRMLANSCCKNIDGVWYPLDADLKLSHNFLAKLNHMQKVTDLFWDWSGNRQPIRLQIQSVPFTPSPETNPVIVLSYLIIGEQYIPNLNQTPAWQGIRIDWWETDHCSIGVELMNKYTNSRSYRCTPERKTPWGFFEMLKLANVSNDHLFTWTLDGEGSSEPPLVSLYFEKNPKLIFMTDKK